MKKIRCLFAVSLIMVIATGAIAAKPDHGVSPPPGDHFNINCVTAWTAFSGEIAIVVDSNSLNGIDPTTAELTGDLTMTFNDVSGVLTDTDPVGTLTLSPVPIAAGSAILSNGTGAYAGWVIEVTITGPTVVDDGEHETTTYTLTGHIEKPHEILVPLVGITSIGIQVGEYMVADNDATDGPGWIQLPAGNYDTYDQARGKPGGEVTWGDLHTRLTKKPVWIKHNGDGGVYGTLVISGSHGPWVYDNDGCTNYALRFYPLAP
jgi:hypothetical protein